jgi:hypothetical protein
MTVGELEVRMSSHELTEWMAYYRIEPFGEERADLRQAMTTAAVHNTIEAQRKNPKWKKAEDFLPFSEKPEPDQVDEPAPPEELKGKLLAFAGKRSG